MVEVLGRRHVRHRGEGDEQGTHSVSWQRCWAGEAFGGVVEVLSGGHVQYCGGGGGWAMCLATW
jgi:hypothetical protein